MEELITIRGFESSLEYELAKSFLESCGIECFGKDEINNRAFISNANGGAKLQVKPEQLEEAIQLLFEKGYLKQEDMEPTQEFKFIEKIISKFTKQ